MILWIVDTSGWWRQGLWRICHTGCSKCESNQVSKIQTSAMAICKHDARGLPILTLQWVLLLFIVLTRDLWIIFYSPVSHHFTPPPHHHLSISHCCKKGKSKSHFVWHRKWCSRYRDCVLTKVCFGCHLQVIGIRCDLMAQRTWLCQFCSHGWQSLTQQAVRMPS